MIECIKETKADRIDCMGELCITIRKDMEEYSGWTEWEHLCWISDLTGLSAVELSLLVEKGYLVMTDESVSRVWLLSNDYYKTTARLLFGD